MDMKWLRSLFGRKKAPPAAVRCTPKPERDTSAPAAEPSKITDEQQLNFLREPLEQKLNSRSEPSLPIASLRVKAVLGDQRICWHFAQGYRVVRDTDAAALFLRQENEPYGREISASIYVGDPEGNRTQCWDFTFGKPSGSLASTPASTSKARLLATATGKQI